MGSIVLGNDGSSGGKIYIRPDDEFQSRLTPGGAPGHSHVVIMASAAKDPAGIVHWSYPSLLGIHGGSWSDSVPSDPQYNFGPNNRGVLAFYTATPYPQPDSSLDSGIEMGRMETNGWNFRGTMVNQLTTATVNSGSSYVLDFGTNNYVEVTLNASPITFVTRNPHGGATNVQNVTLVIHSGAASRTVTFPPWKVAGGGLAPTVLSAATTMFVRLEILGNGGDTNTYARFETYK